MTHHTSSESTAHEENQIDRRRFITAAGAVGAAAFVGPAAWAAASRQPDEASYAGVTALITGCSTGFGNLTAKTLARRGATVVASMRATGGRNAHHAEELRAFEAPGRIHVVDIDVDDDASVERGVDEALDRAGEINALVNNAGIISPGPLGLSIDSVRAEFETNVFGGLRVLRAVLPGMERAGNGLIVHVSSGLGRFTLPTAGGYCGSKFAMEAIMEAAAYELHPLGVEVAIVQPGRFETEFQANGRRNMAEARAAWTEAQRGRAEAYAEHLTVLENVMRPATTPPPQQVADLIVDLVGMRRGARPLRAPIDPREAGQRGLQQINGALEQAQVQLLQGSGVGHWATLKE